MRLLTVTNLYPRPDEPERGTFNAALFAALGKYCEVTNLVLVPRVTPALPYTHTLTRSHTSIYVPVFYLPVIGRDWSWRTYQWALKPRRAYADRADAILASWLYPDAVAAAHALWDGKKPFVIKAHGTDRFHIARTPKSNRESSESTRMREEGQTAIPDRINRIGRIAGRGERILDVARKATAVVSNSEFLNDYLVEHGIPPDKATVVRHGVDTDLFRCRPRMEALRRLGREELRDCRIVLWVGNLKRGKRADLMMQAWPAIRRGCGEAGFNNPRLVMIGSGPMERALKKKTGSGVELAGALPQRQVALWMSAAHCLCLTSDSESMPNVLLEAHASGLPAAACEVGDVKRWAGDGSRNTTLLPVSSEGCVNRLPGAVCESIKKRQFAERECVKEGTRTWDDAARELMEMLRGE